MSTMTHFAGAPVNHRKWSPKDLNPVLWLDAALSPIAGDKLGNLGSGGAALDATFGSIVGGDVNDPQKINFSDLTSLWMPNTGTGNIASVPHDASFLPTTSLSYRVTIDSTDFTPSSPVFLGGHYDSSGNQRSSAISLNNTSGRPQMYLSSDGITAPNFGSTVDAGLTDGLVYALRFDYIQTIPAVRFYKKDSTRATAYADSLSDSGWTQIGTDVTASVPASLFACNVSCKVAGLSGNVGHNGSMFAFVLKTDGVTKVGVDFTKGITNGNKTGFTAETGQTVTIARQSTGGKAVALTRPTILIGGGSNDYLEIADNANLNFGANEAFSLLTAYRMWNGQTGVIIGKQDAVTTTVGWQMYGSAAGGDLRSRLWVGDGVNATNVSSTGGQVITLGNLTCPIFTRDTDGSFTGYLNKVKFTNGASPGAEPDSLSNALPLRIGNTSSGTLAYAHVEFFGAAICRRKITDNEAYMWANFYGENQT